LNSFALFEGRTRGTPGARCAHHGLRGTRTQNIENNPMQSSLAVAGLPDPAKTF
jgi:hypothetical protein